MHWGPTTKPKATVVASLESTAKEALAQHGTCEVALKKGALRVTDLGNGEIGIEGISTNGNPRFQFSVKGGQVTYVMPTNRELIGLQYGSERQFLSQLDGLIQRALDKNTLSTLPYPKNADPSQASFGQRAAATQTLSLQDRISAAWNSVNSLLTAHERQNGGNIGISIYSKNDAIDSMLLIRRGGYPQTIVIEMTSPSDRRDILVDNSITLKPDSISYDPVYGDSVINEDALAIFEKWFAKLEQAASSPQDKPA